MELNCSNNSNFSKISVRPRADIAAMCSASAAEDSDATVCGEEDEDGSHSPSLIGTGTNAGLPGCEHMTAALGLIKHYCN